MALLIPTDGALRPVFPPEGRRAFTLAELQGYVGGYLEVLPVLPDGRIAWWQALSLQRLRARIPSDCPLVVSRDAQRGGFLACTIDRVDQCHGRFQVVHAFVDGYVAAWTRARPRVDAVSRTALPVAAPPTQEPVNWEASYHQACDDADAYKADAEKRLTKIEQHWRSCQHEINYLRERLAIAKSAPLAAVEEQDRR